MAYQVGELVQGTITKIVSYGAFMVFEDEATGLLHISEVANTYIRNLYHYLHVGAIYLVKVIAVDEEKNFLKVSLKQVSKEERENNKGEINERIKKQIDFTSLGQQLPHFIEKTLQEIKPNENNLTINNREEKNMVDVNLNHLIDSIDFSAYQDKVKTIHQGIHNKSLAGNDFLGWLNYPTTYDQNELALIIEKAKYVRENFDTLVVCGIGGSYLGALAAINALKGLYPNDSLKIIFMGQTFSSTYIAQVMDYLKDKKFAINVISKSGTTTETSISFRLLKQLLDSYKLVLVSSKTNLFSVSNAGLPVSIWMIHVEVVTMLVRKLLIMYMLVKLRMRNDICCVNHVCASHIKCDWIKRCKHTNIWNNWDIIFCMTVAVR